MSTKQAEATDMQVFNKLESEVRSYCRSFRTVFKKASNAFMWDVHDRRYIDFFAGAGALNYGHNDDSIRKKLVEYLMSDGVAHSLDMATEAKESFLVKFQNVILKPRGLDYKVMFPGPTGTNTVESALKIARKATGRTNVICFTNAFHGMTQGSLAATGNRFKRGGAGQPLGGTTFMPYDGYFGEEQDTSLMLGKLLDDPGSGIDLPAAVILETVQGEGGLNLASPSWLRSVERICRKHGILLIVDDVQMGCGRTGSFFSFEDAGLSPDIVCLSKSIGGYGLPLALTLIKPEYDIWRPGEHNGTFRGNNLGFVAATEALRFWENGQFQASIERKSVVIGNALKRFAANYPELVKETRGKGFIQGLVFHKPEHAASLCAEAFSNGLIMETSGPFDEVAKLMPPLTIEESVLRQGLAIVEQGLDRLQASLATPSEPALKQEMNA
ncbi:diaminobutyrate--2-oxoglutarate transaminase [Paenibacillus arenilitoris]|uniref:Diaminobutyrate--2-oxoglutarate transaminase n=1 Tax=Paenibacillus arenilitoris TaxID=2772299 RepID=A0A927CPU9_9BACL|nr:diaminobutyrate--2-oxoglutarate transaminase [Paenibacillus arenilitoris]MBD2869741.1 diaminobutyrate--2-oxoglutarate transaminase [Paenibacillus arenilitoris]